MAYVAAHAPHALRYFGVKQSLFDLAQAAATGRGNAPPSPPPPEGSRNCDEAPGALARTAPPPLAKAPEPEPAPTPEPAPAPKPAPAPEPARAPEPGTAAKETKADGPTAAGSKGGGRSRRARLWRSRRDPSRSASRARRRVVWARCSRRSRRAPAAAATSRAVRRVLRRQAAGQGPWCRREPRNTQKTQNNCDVPYYSAPRAAPAVRPYAARGTVYYSRNVYVVCRESRDTPEVYVRMCAGSGSSVEGCAAAPPAARRRRGAYMGERGDREPRQLARRGRVVARGNRDLDTRPHGSRCVWRC